MGLREDILNTEKYNESDRRDFQVLLDRYLECDKWAKNIFKDVGVLLTSHPGNRAFLKASVESHKRLGYWLTLAYDNYFDPDIPNRTWDDIMPNRDVIEMVDTFIMPHYQTWGGVLYPYFWLLKFGLYAMSGFKYILCSNGDCVIDKPENFPQILELMGDADVFTVGWTEKEFYTATFIGTSEALIAIVDHMERNFIPLEKYEQTKQSHGNCESRMHIAVKELGLKVAEVKNPYNEQLHKTGYGTWYDILGFRHIHGEFAYAYRYKSIPPEPMYYDTRHLSGSDKHAVEEYWKTKDMKVLENWWAK